MTTRRPNAYTQSLQEAQNRIENMPENQQTINPETRETGKTEKQKNKHTVKQKTSKTLEASDRIKATFYLDPEDILTIDEVQMQRFRESGKKPLKSDVVSEALKLLRKQTRKPE